MGQRSRIPGVRSTRAIFFRVTEQEYRDLEAVAKENGMKVAETVRHATNEFVADYRDRPVFRRTMGPGRASPLGTERTRCDG